jgi:hypothetical protein
MSDRIPEILLLSRIELMALHAGEINSALCGSGIDDDEYSDDQKSEIISRVVDLRRKHRFEISTWDKSNSK